MTLALATLELNLQTNGNNSQILPIAQKPRKIDCEVLHAIPGRIRLGIPNLAGDSGALLQADREYRDKLTYALQSLVWVSEVRINPAASCAIINYQSSPASESQQQASILALVQEADSLALLPTATLESLEADLASFWDWLSGELKNFFEGFEGVGKAILTAFGMVSLMVGIAGLILPLLPGTPFLLLSSLCFLAVS